MPEVIKNAKKPQKRIHKAVDHIKDNLAQYLPGLVDFKQGAGEAERQAVNARILASTAAPDTLNTPPASISIHVSIYIIKYKGGDN